MALTMLVAVATIAVLVVCRSCDHRAFTSKDSWFQPPKDIMPFWSAGRLADFEIVEVSAKTLAQAEEMSRDTACVAVSSDDAMDLTGRRITAPAGKSLFLVRAVYLNRGTGKFQVIPLGQALLVYHGSLGHGPVPMKRQPLIVCLSQKPDAVYVECGMAE